MKKHTYILIAILVVIIGLLSSCDQRDTEPLPTDILEQPFDGGGADDDEDPIVIGDTTKVSG